MRLTDELTIHDLSIHHRPSNTLILGDTHIGEEDALNQQGIFVPKFAFQDLYKRTQRILNDIKPGHVVLNGDIKHNFGHISDDEWSNVETYLDLLLSHAELTLVRGNHDVLLDPITERSKITVKDYAVIGDTFICHGHTEFDNEISQKAETIIIGHEHPAVTLRSGERSEHYKAFLKGKYGDQRLIVMPSMNQLREGSDILQEQRLSPYLDDASILGFHVYVVGENKEVLDFGQVRNLQPTRSTGQSHS